MTAVTDVVRTYTDDELEEILVEALRAAKTPVTDWGEVGFLKSLRDQWQRALSSFLGVNDGVPRLREAIVAGAFPILAELQTLDTSDFLALFCEQFFKTIRNYDWDGTQFAGTFTRQAVTFACASGKGPITLTGGAAWVKSSVTGNRYNLVSTVVVPNGGTVAAVLQSEHPNDSLNGQNYADGAGTLTVLENPLPGLSVSNTAPTFSDVTTTPEEAAGLGVVTVSGTPPASETGYDFEITSSGQAADVVFRYRSNGGAWIEGQVTTAGAFVIPSGPTVTFTDDGAADPSFIAGDRYSFASPGTPITQQGIDPESDAALLERAFTRWPDIEEEAPRPKHEVWAKAADPLVKRVRVSKTSGKPGFVDVTIAGVVNPLDAGVVTAVQTYIDQHEAIGDQSQVAAASVVVANPGGFAYVRAANMAAVKAAAAVAWNAYVNDSDIGGELRLARLDKVLVDAGVQDCAGLEINGAAANLVLAPDQVAMPAALADWDLEWIGV